MNFAKPRILYIGNCVVRSGFAAGFGGAGDILAGVRHERGATSWLILGRLTTDNGQPSDKFLALRGRAGQPGFRGGKR
jgi:hypothetical protein